MAHKKNPTLREIVNRQMKSSFPSLFFKKMIRFLTENFIFQSNQRNEPSTVLIFKMREIFTKIMMENIIV